MRNDVEPLFVGWVVMNQPVMFPKDEIKDVQIVAFKSEDSELDGSFCVRMVKASPTIEFICADEEEAEKLYKWLKDSMKVVHVDFKNKERKIDE